MDPHGRNLQAIGRLAAGIAHEINTPTQFVGDTIRFLREAFGDVLAMHDGVRGALDDSAVAPELLERVRAAEEAADLEYLRERVPAGFERAEDGVRRIGTIVGAMRDFAHPTVERAPQDLNAALRNTLVVATGEYKAVADVETDLGELPLVTCNGGEVKQALLNLIVNAAHAIEDGSPGERGTIRIRTRTDATHVLISVADTGCGIPAQIADRVFDPFFTTKEVGAGTGLGLSITYSILKDYGGDISIESRPGKGATFVIELPFSDQVPAQEPLL
jgi:signal transduction histidine kinase